jgi:DNA-binding NtrC family response regulator
MDSNVKPIRLLLVDDEEEFLTATSQAMNRRGFEITTAPNGVTALDFIEERDFDAIVLDVKMPDIGGLEVFNQIRALRPEMPTIILTGHPSIRDAFKTARQGIADYLSKPVDIEELAKKVRQVVSDSRQIPGENKPIDKVVDVPINVLIVDDEVEFLDSLQRVFSRRGISTATSNSGLRALEILKEQPVDVVVLDVKMPGMDGLDVLRRIKQLFPNIQVILLSGHPSVDAAIEGARLGASEYLKKPPIIEELVETVVRLHQRRKEMLEDQQKELIDEIRRRYTD